MSGRATGVRPRPRQRPPGPFRAPGPGRLLRWRGDPDDILIRFGAASMMLNDLQAYMVHEYVADYKAGYLSRRDLIRRVLNICGGLGGTAPPLPAPGPSETARQPNPP